MSTPQPQTVDEIKAAASLPVQRPGARTKPATRPNKLTLMLADPLKAMSDKMSDPRGTFISPNLIDEVISAADELVSSGLRDESEFQFETTELVFESPLLNSRQLNAKLQEISQTDEGLAKLAKIIGSDVTRTKVKRHVLDSMDGIADLIVDRILLEVAYRVGFSPIDATRVLEQEDETEETSLETEE